MTKDNRKLKVLSIFCFTLKLNIIQKIHPHINIALMIV